MLNINNIEIVRYKTVKMATLDSITKLVLLLLLLLLLLLTAIELSLGGCSPYTSTDKTSKNKYT